MNAIAIYDRIKRGMDENRIIVDENEIWELVEKELRFATLQRDIFKESKNK